MGEVAVKYKIMCDPDFDGANADVIAGAMESMTSEVGVVQMVETKPLAFGLKFVEAHCVIQEGDGTVDAFEDSIRGIDGVGEVEVLEIGRL
jgi:translation elongation factor aEF-1 beta|tara:strand:- start:12 stop:284 length:273 start_codon:yes stop_codon:yes gene_type:complete